MVLVKGMEVRRADRRILFGALRSYQQVDHGVSPIAALRRSCPRLPDERGIRPLL
jgi:hypothetical protein